MSITYTLNNLSTETAEAVNIHPFRQGWTEVPTTAGNGKAKAFAQAGDDPEYPVTLTVYNQPRKVFHASQGRVHAKDGRETVIALSSDVSVEDSVRGKLESEVVNVELRIQHTGQTLPDQDDALQMCLTVLSFLYGGVTANEADTDKISIVAIGGLDLV